MEILKGLLVAAVWGLLLTVGVTLLAANLYPHGEVFYAWLGGTLIIIAIRGSVFHLFQDIYAKVRHLR